MTGTSLSTDRRPKEASSRLVVEQAREGNVRCQRSLTRMKSACSHGRVQRDRGRQSLAEVREDRTLRLVIFSTTVLTRRTSECLNLDRLQVMVESQTLPKAHLEDGISATRAIQTSLLVKWQTSVPTVQPMAEANAIKAKTRRNEKTQTR